MSKKNYKFKKWPIDIKHGWMIWVANNSQEDFYSACHDIKVKIGDINSKKKILYSK